MTNKALSLLYSSLIISGEQSWVVVESPDQDTERNLRIYIRPKFRDGLTEILVGSRAQVIATDATMPLAAITKLNEILGLKFNRINIGDPQNTADLMRIVPWPIEVGGPQLKKWIGDTATPQQLSAREWLTHHVASTLDAMCCLFGEANFVVAVPSKTAANYVKWICKEYELPRLDIMWHRGRESVGVENEKRIMLGLTAPYAPRQSQNWIKEAIHPDLLEDYNNDTLWRYNQRKVNNQTMSRIKDPRFGPEDRQRRSAYIAFGQLEHMIEAMRLDLVCPPEALPVYRSYQEPHDDLWFGPLFTAWMWLKNGEEVTKSDIAAASHLWSGLTPDQLRHHRFANEDKLPMIHLNDLHSVISEMRQFVEMRSQLKMKKSAS